MTAYYNEIDPHAAQWLRNLMTAGMIPEGDVDERSIEDVRPDELRGYAQCHFFAGIGGWVHALDLAGWPRSRPVWTGSCPCQPFSAAGKGAGFDDERHLWPAWQHLIAQCRPAIVFGEQVASKAADPWIDLVHADLEGMGYAFGCVPFPAAGVGAPHIRDRNYWMAHTDNARLEGWRIPGERADQFSAGEDCVARGVADSGCAGRSIGGETDDQSREMEAPRSLVARIGDATGCSPVVRPGPVNGHWRNADWIGSQDGKWRPVEPGTFPLGHGLPARVVRLRAYGNAIVPQQAAQFVSAYMEAAEAIREAA